MNLSQNLTIALYQKQTDFIQCEDRFSAFIGGIGSGKTFAGCAKALYWTAKTKGRGIIIAPTYRMLADATIDTFMQIGKAAVTNWNKSDMIADMRGGGRILFRSADNPEHLRGPNLHWAYIDEGALAHAMTWPITIGRLRADGLAGPCWVTTTPKGRNWVYQQAGQMTIFRAKTRENPFLAPEFIASLEASYTGKFAQQELDGEFVSFEGLIYDEFDRNIHVTEYDGRFVEVVAGVDEGYTNPAVIVPVGIDYDGRLHVIDEFYKRRVLQGDLVAEAVKLRDKYNITRFIVDPSAAGLIAEMQATRLTVKPANNAVNDGIQRTKARFKVQADGRPRLSISPSCVNVMAELESYTWKEGKTGTQDEPEKINDHAMDALRYVVMDIDCGRTFAKPGVAHYA